MNLKRNQIPEHLLKYFKQKNKQFICRNDVIWGKPNGMPESVTDRFSKKHEFVFFFVKQEKYFFDLDAVRDKVKYQYDSNDRQSRWSNDYIGLNQGERKSIDKEKPPYSVLDSDFRPDFVEKRDLPEHEILREYISENRKNKGITIEEIENIFESQAPHHWFEKNGSYPSKEDWIKLKEILQFDDTFDIQMTEITLKSGQKQNNENGKNPGDVSDFWDIPTKPSKHKHYASYNDSLLVKPILAGCPEFVCKKCGKPREKIIKRTGMTTTEKTKKLGSTEKRKEGGEKVLQNLDYKAVRGSNIYSYEIDGLTDCGCNAGFEGGIIYDPFMGTGSTAEVALRSNRRFIGSEMSKEYCDIANKRLQPFLLQKTIF